MPHFFVVMSTVYKLFVYLTLLKHGVNGTLMFHIHAVQVLLIAKI